MEGRPTHGDHAGECRMEVNLKYAWKNPSSGIKKPPSLKGELKLLSQAHSLWLNMWLIDHAVEIPAEEKQ